MLRQLTRTREHDRLQARLIVHKELMNRHCEEGGVNTHQASEKAMADLREMTLAAVIRKANEFRNREMLNVL